MLATCCILNNLEILGEVRYLTKINVPCTIYFLNVTTGKCKITSGVDITFLLDSPELGNKAGHVKRDAFGAKHSVLEHLLSPQKCNRPPLIQHFY